MTTEKERAEESSPNGAASWQTTACPSCRAQMLHGMRFCRLCGFRLGEGIEEFAETRRFDGTLPHAAQAAHAEAARGAFSSAGMPREWGAVVPASTHNSSLGRDDESTSWQGATTGACRRTGGARLWLWIVVAIAIMAAMGGIGKFARSVRVNGRQVAAVEHRSYVGATLEDGEGGAFVEAVDIPGAPLDRAGLLGGDTITSFDGKRVGDEDDLTELLRATPAGKTVEVGYTRDGEARTTTITTISGDERERLKDLFNDRPEGEGFLGIDDGELERIFLPELKTHGVKMGEVIRNRPGYIAGLRDGDVVVEFGGVPVRTGREFVARIERAAPDSVVPVVVIRGGARMEIPVRIGIDD